MMSLFARSVSGLVVAIAVFMAAEVGAALPNVSGTYTTPVRQGTIKFKIVKAVVQFGYQGNVIIDGKSYPGVLYRVRGTQSWGLAWYYGVSGNTAGDTVVSPVAGTNNFTGPMTFYDRKGNVTETGTANVTIVIR